MGRSLALAATLAACVTLALAGCSSGSGAGGSGSSASSSATSLSATSGAQSASGFDGAALPPNTVPRDFSLTDLAGHAVSLRSFRGKVTVLAFVFANCGAACTLIAQQIRGALDELAHAATVLLISVDPAADTPQRVGRFLARAALSGRSRYLTGSRAALERVWRAFGVIPPSRGRAAFERAASVMLLDRRGAERVIFGLEQLTPEGLAHDIRVLEGEP